MAQTQRLASQIFSDIAVGSLALALIFILI